MRELEELLGFARDICHQAGRLTLGYFDRSLEVIDKADGSPVTIADREAEALIRRAIEARYPDHGISGEEYGVKESPNGSPYTWYIDPIDGTKSFIHGAPIYTTLLGLAREGECVLGVIEAPALKEQLSASAGMGAHLNGRRVRVSQVSDLSRAVLVVTDPRSLEQEAVTPGWRRLWDGCKFVRTWGDAFGYMMVATGRAEIMLDEKVEPYDVSPLPVILREAGGAFFDWTGKETIFGGNGAASNAALRDTVVEALRG